MNRTLLPFIAIAFLFSCNEIPGPSPEIGDEEKAPGEYMFQQRAFPAGTINMEAYRSSLNQAVAMRRNAVQVRNAEPWENVGPTNIGGRITSLAASPDGQTIYAGAASGGVWKTTDDGLAWAPIFDDAPTLSIGDLAVAPSDPQTIYVGTGESNAGGGSLAYDGFGVFKTTDGGGFLDWAWATRNGEHRQGADQPCRSEYRVRGGYGVFV